MVLSAFVAYVGHLDREDPLEHFAAKQFIEQLNVLERKPELLAQVVTPAMIEQAVDYVTFLSEWCVYKYAPDLLDIVERYPQFQDAAEKRIVNVMHRQLNQPEAQKLGLQYCQKLDEDLMGREKFASFLTRIVETDEVIAGALAHLFSPVPMAPIAKNTLGKLAASGEAPAA